MTVGGRERLSVARGLASLGHPVLAGRCLFELRIQVGGRTFDSLSVRELRSCDLPARRSRSDDAREREGPKRLN